MLDRIMVGYDGSEESEDALALGGGLAAASEGRLLVTRVFEFGPFWAVAGGGLAPTPGEIVSDYERDAIGHLETVAQRVGAEGRWVVSDTAAHGLHAAAERGEADLLVVGSSHRHALGQVFPGGTGFRLLHGAPCPVAVAPRGMRDRPESKPSSIVVAFDGRDEARLALDAAYGLAQRFGASVRVVAVAASPLIVYGTGFVQGRGIAGEQYDALAAAAEKSLRARLDEVIAEAPEGVEVAGELLRGDPVNGIVEASAGSDLLVLGSRGYGPLRGVLLGSVSMDVLRRASCPVMVVPRAASGDSRDEGSITEPATAQASR
jgi:nucleotide-binding universal stress UspA family protein